MPTVIQTREFKNWVLALRDRRARLKIAQRIERYKATGALGDVKSVGDRISEMRIHLGPGYRIYFTTRGREIIILLCGSDKSDQVRMIARAKEMAQAIDAGEGD